MAIPRLSTQRNWRPDGECLSPGFAITLVLAPRRKNASPAFALGATFASSGGLPGWWNGSKKNATRSHFSLDLLIAKQDNPDMGHKKNPNAQALGRLGGKARAESLSDAEITKIASKGGKARAAKLTAGERRRIAKLGVAARERKRRGKS